MNHRKTSSIQSTNYEIKKHLERWRIYAKSATHRRRVREALGIIEDAIELPNVKWCLSWSSGKDSTAMVHLGKRLDPDMVITTQFDDCDYADKKPYMERVMVSQGWSIHECWPTFSVWDEAIKVDLAEDLICTTEHWLGFDSFVKPLQELRHRLGCNGVMLGLRAKESRVRRLNATTRGPLYQLKNGTWRCCPVMNWEAIDCLAYLASNNVEINPCYFRNAFRQPEEIRLSWALPTRTSIRYGDMVHMRKYYPHHWERLCEVQPKLRSKS